MKQRTMDPTRRKQRAASLLLKEKIDELSPTEKEELDSWLRESPRNERTYARSRAKDFTADLARYREIDTARGLERYRERYPRKPARRFTRWQPVAAAAVLVIGVCTLFFFQRESTDLARATIVPGSPKAILVLDNGETIDLSGKNKNEIVSTGEFSIRNDSSRLLYTITGNAEKAASSLYNELIVPRGGEFTLTLSDGTRVWLNSQSKIRYPVMFDGIAREVSLEGEAYFEVAKDPQHPFHVNARNGVNIEVLGTAFNVKCYADENTVETVLEEGAVKMSEGKDTVLLSPGHKAVYHPGEPIRVTAVNTELYTAWRQGQYIFMDESVESILRQLARWYDIEVFYSSEEAKSATFSGDVRKYNNINTILEAMEIAGDVRFSINGRRLTVNYDTSQ